MAVVKNLMVRVGGDFSEFAAGMKNLSKDLKSLSKTLKSTGEDFTKYVTLPVLGAGTAAFKLASDMEESLNKVNVAFKNDAKTVKDWSETTLESFGIAQGTALDMAALFGDMATSMGLSTKEASNMSMSLVGLAGDLASFKNIGIDEAQTALKGVFTGETESLKNLGIVMTEANLGAYALSQGITKNIDDFTQAEKTQLRYNYVLDATTNAQGDFSRTSDGAANQMRIFTESLKELGATFGEVLLPIITPIIEKLNNLVQKLGDLDLETRELVVNIGLFAAAIGPVLLLLGNLAQVGSNVAKAFATMGVASGAAGAAGGVVTLGTKMTAVFGTAGIALAAIGVLSVLVLWLQRVSTESQKAFDNIEPLTKTGASIGTLAPGGFGTVVANAIQREDEKAATTLAHGGSRAGDAYGTAVTEAAEIAITDSFGSVTQTVVDKLEILEASFDLWTATVGVTASESEKLNRQLEYENAQLDVVNQRVASARTAYEQMAIVKGANSNESQQLYLNLLNELKAQADLENQINETNKALQDQMKIKTEISVDSSGNKSGYSYDPVSGSAIVVSNGEKTYIDKTGKMTTITPATDAEIAEAAKLYPNYDLSVLKSIVENNKIPKLASGGIVTEPTLAMIGEAGPEAVVPLGKSSGMNVTVNVRSPFDVARELDYLDKKLAWGI